MTSQEFPAVFDTSIKLEETAKGVRISVHVYGNGRGPTVEEAVKVYMDTQQECRRKQVVLAPVEVKETK